MTAKDSKGPELRSKGRPSVEDTARIDRTILDAARKVLLERGEAASLNAVAREAGLSRKSVYARYGSREALFLAAVRLTLRDVTPTAFADAAEFQTRLGNYINAALDLLSSNAAVTFQQALTTNIHVVPDMRDELTQASRKIFFDPLLDLLENARDRDEIDVPDLQMAASVIFNAMIAQAMSARMTGPAQSIAKTPNTDYARGLARIVSQGLVRHPDAPLIVS